MPKIKKILNSIRNVKGTVTPKMELQTFFICCFKKGFTLYLIKNLRSKLKNNAGSEKDCNTFLIPKKPIPST